MSSLFFASIVLSFFGLFGYFRQMFTVDSAQVSFFLSYEKLKEVSP